MGGRRFAILEHVTHWPGTLPRYQCERRTRAIDCRIASSILRPRRAKPRCITASSTISSSVLFALAQIHRTIRSRSAEGYSSMDGRRGMTGGLTDVDAAAFEGDLSDAVAGALDGREDPLLTPASTIATARRNASSALVISLSRCRNQSVDQIRWNLQPSASRCC